MTLFGNSNIIGFEQFHEKMINIKSPEMMG